MVQYSLWDDSLKKAFIDELLERYRLGEYDLPTLTLMLLDIPHLDVSEFLHRSLSHRERWQAFQKIKRNTKLPKDGIWRLEELYFGNSR